MAPDFEGAQVWALQRLEQDLPPYLTYHNLWHTRDEVLPCASRLATMLAVGGRDLQLVELGAAYHDIGFTVTTVEHERAGAIVAAEILPQYGLCAAEVAIVQGMIIATKLPQSPCTLLEEIVADADLDSLWREDFASRSLALRLELAARGMPMTDPAWYARQLAFLETHHYFTSAAQSLRGEGKRRNIESISQLLAESLSC